MKTMDRILLVDDDVELCGLVQDYLTVEGFGEDDVAKVAGGFPYVRISGLGAESWLMSLNARTLVEMWRAPAARKLAESIVSELDSKNVCPVFNQVVFGEKADAR